MPCRLLDMFVLLYMPARNAVPDPQRPLLSECEMLITVCVIFSRCFLHILLTAISIRSIAPFLIRVVK